MGPSIRKAPFWVVISLLCGYAALQAFLPLASRLWLGGEGEISFSSFSFGKGKVVFHNFSYADPRGVLLFAPEAEVGFSSTFPLTLREATIAVDGVRGAEALVNGPSYPGDLFIPEGRLYWWGKRPWSSACSISKSQPGEIARVELARDTESVSLHAWEEEGGIVVTCATERLSAEWGGALCEAGPIAWDQGSCAGRMAFRLSRGGEFLAVNGAVAGEGLAGRIGAIEVALADGAAGGAVAVEGATRFRIIAHGCRWKGERSGGSDGEVELFYDREVGLKGKVSAPGSVWEGKSAPGGEWMEMASQHGEGAIRLSKQGERWECSGSRVGAETFAAWIDLAEAAGYHDRLDYPFYPEQGTYHWLIERSAEGWKCQELGAEGALWQTPIGAVGCHRAEWRASQEEGLLTVEGIVCSSGEERIFEEGSGRAIFRPAQGWSGDLQGVRQNQQLHVSGRVGCDGAGELLWSSDLGNGEVGLQLSRGAVALNGRVSGPDFSCIGAIEARWEAGGKVPFAMHVEQAEIPLQWVGGALKGGRLLVERGDLTGDASAWREGIAPLSVKGIVDRAHITFAEGVSLADFSGELYWQGREGFLRRARARVLADFLPDGLEMRLPICGIKEGQFECDVQVVGPGEREWLRCVCLSHGERPFRLLVDPVRSHCADAPIVDSWIEWEPRQGLIAARLAAKLPVEPLARWLGMSGFRGSVQCLFNQAPGAAFEALVEGIDTEWNSRPFPLYADVAQEKGGWRFRSYAFGPVTGHAFLQGGRVEEGYAAGNGAEVRFAGKIGVVSALEVEQLAGSLENWFPALKGEVAGKGAVGWDGKEKRLAIDLDLDAPSCSIGGVLWENRGSLHLSYNGQRIELSGIAGQAPEWGAHADAELVIWDGETLSAQKAHLHCPLASLPLPTPLPGGLSLSGHLAWTPHEQKVFLEAEQVFIPLWGAIRHLQGLRLNVAPQQVALASDTIHHGRPYRLQADWNRSMGALSLAIDDLEGHLLTARLSSVDLSRFRIEEVSGEINGCSAQLQRNLEGALAGMLTVDGNRLVEFLPQDAADALQAIQLGKGYELIGEADLFADSDGSVAPRFRGLIRGRDADLFGYTLRSIQAQAELKEGSLLFSDLEAADSAGKLVCPRLALLKIPEQGWELAIEPMRCTEFRPSLLRKVGQELGPITPLLIREGVTTSIRGILGQDASFSGGGTLHFLNSFKRTRSFFDIPSALIGRIFGFDVELMIPIRGTLDFSLKEGAIYLDDLKDAYSEGERSQFFLVSSPKISFDGKIDVLIQMKQYVLFKLTQAFLISIDGTLSDPQYHLQKKP
jgi:hypothetical protein